MQPAAATAFDDEDNNNNNDDDDGNCSLTCHVKDCIFMHLAATDL